MSELDKVHLDSLQTLMFSDENRICLNFEETYEKIKQLGIGSFSTVSLYRKKNPTNKESRFVALKVLNTNSLDRTQIDLAINEVKILSILKHQNIINYYGSFVNNGRFYIEMEYADAGTLAEFLASLLNPLEQMEILALFAQIVSAIAYLHQRNVIHRDIKTTNIFLNKQGFIKIGDFGISKILDSKLEDARSFVGTPFYISPEICEGKSYNKPCDIWALGCVLYEMATLHKTFEGNSLPTLMNKIIKGTYVPLDGRYTKQFHKLVNSLLQTNPSKRPNCCRLLDKIILMLNKMSSQEASIANVGSFKELYPSEPLLEYIKEKSNVNLVRCSYLYYLDIYSKRLDLIQVKFPHRIQVKELSKGQTHFLVLSMEGNIYSWGYGPNGELAHGSQLHRLNSPTLIKSLSKYSISKLGAGQGFSIFLTKNGLLLTCGSRRSYCLGNNELVDCFEPKLVNQLLRINIIDLSCSRDHVGAISSEGLAYAWGLNVYGKLGSNDNSSAYRIEPMPVCAPANVKFKRVFCGSDCTALIDYANNLWFCGNNSFNKLALNKTTLLNTQIISFASIPRKAKLTNKCKVTQLSIGIKHTIIMSQNSKIIVTGCNCDGQLGLEHTNGVKIPSLVPSLKQLQIKKIKAGSCFTLALTKNSVYFWGSRKRFDNKDSKEHPKEENLEFIVGNCGETLMDIVQTYGPDYPIIKTIEPKIMVNDLTDLQMINSASSVILTAQNILNIYSPKTLQTGELFLNDIYCFEDDSVYVVIDALVDDCSINSQIIITDQDKFSFQIKSEVTSNHSYAWVNNEG